MTLDLRPLTLAELLDRSFSTYKRHLWLFVGIMAVPASIALVYSVVIQIVQFSLGLQPKPGETVTPDEVMWRMVPVFIGAIVFLLIYLVVYAFALGATTIAIAHLYRGERISVGRAYREVKGRGGRLILLLVWAGLRIGGAWVGTITLCAVVAAAVALITPVLSPFVVLIGFLASGVLVMFFVVRYGVAVPAVVLEQHTAGEALARSVSLTEDHRGRVFLVVLCSVVITYATAALLQGPFMLGAFIAGPGSSAGLVLTLAGAVLGTVGGMFSGPLMKIGLAMLYYDLRIRKEALDLQMMLEALDAPSA